MKAASWRLFRIIEKVLTPLAPLSPRSKRLNHGRGVKEGRLGGEDEEAATSLRAVGVLTCKSLGARGEVNLISDC